MNTVHRQNTKMHSQKLTIKQFAHKQSTNNLHKQIHITKTCLCNVYPREPHFYIAKLRYAGVYLFFLFLLQNIDCGYSLEPPRCGSNLYPEIYVLSNNKKNIKIFLMKFSIFTGEKNLCILHGQVFEMQTYIQGSLGPLNFSTAASQKQKLHFISNFAFQKARKH